MKVIPAGLLAHIQAGGTTLAWALKLTRTDGAVYGWTSSDREVEFDGVVYRADIGLDVASIVSTAMFAVDNTEIVILANATITRTDILAGRWDGAAFELFRYNWAAPDDGIDVVKVGNLGNVMPRRGAYVAELRTLRQRLQQMLGNVTQPTCRNRLGDSRCKVNLEYGSPSFTVTGTITSVTSRQVFRDSTRTEVIDWFAEGEITFLSGGNEAIRAKVKAYAADGTVTLAIPLVYELEPGDEYQMVVGCRKRRDEDCFEKFGNVVNFNGEPDLPGIDSVFAPPNFTEP